MWVLTDGLDRIVTVGDSFDKISQTVDKYFSRPDFSNYEWVMRKGEYPVLHVTKNPPYHGSNVDYFYAKEMKYGEVNDY